MTSAPTTSTGSGGLQPSQLQQEPPVSFLSLQPGAPSSSGMELDAQSDSSDLDNRIVKSSADRSVGAKGVSNRSAPAPFISKLFDIATQYPDVLGWGENGESILVHDLKALETTVLPIYFRHGNYRSFVRQLNLYEFRKDNNRKHIEYRHPEFLRSRPERLHLVERPKLGALPHLYDAPGASNSSASSSTHVSSSGGGNIMPRAGEELSKSLSGSSGGGDVDSGALSGADADDSHYEEAGMPLSSHLHEPNSVQSSSSVAAAAAAATAGSGGGGGMPNMNMLSSAMAWMLPPGMLQSSGSAAPAGPQLPFWRPGERCECLAPVGSSSSSSSGGVGGGGSEGSRVGGSNSGDAWQPGFVEAWATEGLLVRLDAQPAPQRKPEVVPFARIHVAVRKLHTGTSSNAAAMGGAGVKSTVGTSGSTSGSTIGSGNSSGAVRPIMPMPMAGMMGFGGGANMFQQQQQQAYMAAMHAQMHGQAMNYAGSPSGPSSSSSSSTSASSAATAAAAAANAAVAAAANGTMAQKLCASEAARLALTSTVATLEAEAVHLRSENADMQRRMQAMEQQLSALLGGSSSNSYSHSNNNSRSNSCSNQGSAIAPALDPVKSFDSGSDQHAAVVTGRLVSSPRASFAGRGDSYGREGSRTRSSVTPSRPSEARSEGSSVGRGKRHAERALSSEPREDDPSLQLRLANRAFTHANSSSSSSSSSVKAPQHEPKVPNLKPLIVTPSAVEGGEGEPEGLCLEAWPVGATEFYPNDDDDNDRDLLAGLDLGPLGFTDDFIPDGLTPMGLMDTSASSSSSHFFNSPSSADMPALPRTSEGGSSGDGSPPQQGTTATSATATGTVSAAAADATQQPQAPFVRRRTMI